MRCCCRDCKGGEPTRIQALEIKEHVFQDERYPELEELLHSQTAGGPQAGVQEAGQGRSTHDIASSVLPVRIQRGESRFVRLCQSHQLADDSAQPATSAGTTTPWSDPSLHGVHLSTLVDSAQCLLYL